MKLKFKNKKKIIIKLLALAVISMIFSSVSASDELRSIKGDWNNAVFGVTLSDGKSLMDSEKSVDERRERNTEILFGRSSHTYSLFDLYGGDIKFVPYYGEVSIKTNLADKIYTAFVGKDGDFKLTVKDIQTLFKKNVVSNNIVYKDRPPIIETQEVIGMSKVDPRVSQGLTNPASLGGVTKLANTNLTLSEMYVSIITWLTGSGLYNSVNEIWEKVMKSGLKDYVKGLLNFFFPLLMILFIYRVAKMIIGMYKGNVGYTAKLFFGNLIGFVIILGTLWTFTENPLIMSGTITKLVNVIDNQFDTVLNMTTESPVVKSDVTQNVRQAALWEKAVFNPWSYGTFGTSWDKTYSIADPDPSHEKLEQTKDDLGGEWEGVRYNSYDAANGGKIYVKRSSSENLHNFAAYAMSLQSKFHISYSGTRGDGYVEGTKEQNKISKEGNNFVEPTWPVALTTPKNDNIYLDYFRLIDSQLDISPEYRSGKKRKMNYTKSREWKQDFYAQSMISLFYSALLTPLGILGIRKVKYSLLLITGGARIVWKSIMWFLRPEQNSVIDNYKSLVSPLLDYLWNGFVIYINITIYLALVDKGLIANIFIILFGLYVLSFSRPKSMSDLKRRLRQTGRWAKERAKRGIEGSTKIIKSYKNRVKA